MVKKYYILYPIDIDGKVRVVHTKPKRSDALRKYGFAEGPLKTEKEVVTRLNWMNIDCDQRPKGYCKIYNGIPYL